MPKLRRVYTQHGGYVVTLPMKWVRQWETEHRQQLENVSVEAGDGGCLVCRPLTEEQRQEKLAEMAALKLKAL